MLPPDALAAQPTKRCCRCGEEKSRADFTPDQRHSDGLMSHCHLCENRRQRKVLEDPVRREGERARGRERYLRDPKRRAGMAKSRAKKPEQYKEWMAAWYQRNRERQATYNKARYDANIEAERAAGRERSRLRYLKNPQEFKDKFHRRRVRLLGNGPIEKVDFAMVCEEAGWRCHVCGLVVDPAVRWPDSFSASRDHLIPVSQGGPHTYENLALAHLRCNIRRYRTITVA